MLIDRVVTAVTSNTAKLIAIKSMSTLQLDSSICNVTRFSALSFSALQAQPRLAVQLR